MLVPLASDVDLMKLVREVEANPHTGVMAYWYEIDDVESLAFMTKDKPVNTSQKIQNGIPIQTITFKNGNLIYIQDDGKKYFVEFK